jgi:hypothetical protein
MGAAFAGLARTCARPLPATHDHRVAPEAKVRLAADRRLLRHKSPSRACVTASAHSMLAFALRRRERRAEAQWVHVLPE